MSNDTDRSAEQLDADEATRQAARQEPLDANNDQRDTDNVEESVIQGPPPNPAAELDQDAPGLSAVGEQSGPPVEPNEPA